MNEETYVEHIRGHLWHRYSITVNQVMQIRHLSILQHIDIYIIYTYKKQVYASEAFWFLDPHTQNTHMVQSPLYARTVGGQGTRLKWNTIKLKAH